MLVFEERQTGVLREEPPGATKRTNKKLNQNTVNDVIDTPPV